MRDKLIELIADVQYMGGLEKKLADHLLDNGIVAPPVKVGQTVWVYNKSTQNIYKNTVVCVKIMGESKYKNRIVVEYRNPYGESSIRKFTWAQIGRQVFLTEDEAIDAMTKGLNGEQKD